VVKAIQAGKNVFVEKPLALTPEEIADIIRAKSIAMKRALYDSEIAETYISFKGGDKHPKKQNSKEV